MKVCLAEAKAGSETIPIREYLAPVLYILELGKRLAPFFIRKMGDDIVHSH